MPIQYQIFYELNLVLMRTWGLLVFDDLTETLESYATHPFAKPGQHLLNDISQYDGSDFDDTARLVLQSRFEPILSIGRRPRKIIMFTPLSRLHRSSRIFAQIWNASPNFDVTIETSEIAAFRHLELPYDSIDELLKSNIAKEPIVQTSAFEKH